MSQKRDDLLDLRSRLLTKCDGTGEDFMGHVVKNIDQMLSEDLARENAKPKHTYQVWLDSPLSSTYRA